MGYNLNYYTNYNDDVFYNIMEAYKRDFKQQDLNPEDLKEIKKRIDAEFQIYQPDGTALLDDYEHEENWYTNKKETINQFYWNRYRVHLFESGWTTEILKQLEFNTLDRLMNYLGDPNANEQFSRKGLVMGDVQSGKTSNYIGLINKAVDAGYKVVILLTGILESLRKQTQIRVEEGFIGYDVNSKSWVGVGSNSPEGTDIPHSVTSRENDFTGISGETTGLHINKSTKTPLIFVTKKNATTLKKIKDTLSNINIVPPNKAINSSLLIIDDEADNASVNTNDPAYDPTKINKEIREILKLFTKKNYVGFTATPFANVFIDPDSVSKMLEDDLFPKDFIFVLNPPSNYFGAEKIFLENKSSNIQIIDDHTDFFPLKHNKDWDGDTFFPSLTEALNCFLLINVIRDLREQSQKNSHRSMLINVSRFINVQNKIEEIVSRKLENIKSAIRHSSRLDFNQYIQNQHILNLYETYQKHYSNQYNWNLIFTSLYDSIENVEVFKVPSKDKNRRLDYEKNKENGLRCIVIGGLALSRGLTLEGLTISYLYRNTSTFDVLMQMGRWFGYRHKPYEYSDLCKVWMLQQTQKYFIEITNSIRLLKEDLKSLVLSKKTPKEFGIRVRNESEILGITDRNKMRNTKKYVYTYDLYGKVLETPFISSNLEHLKHNMSVLEEFSSKFAFDFNGKSLMVSNINKNHVIELLKKLEIHEANRINYFEKDKISKFISQSEYEHFDCVIIGGISPNIFKFGKYEINPIQRSFDLLDEFTIRISGKHRRLGGRNDTQNGLNSEQIRLLGDLKKASNSTFMIEGRNPLILIYPIELKRTKDTDDIIYEDDEIDEINSLVEKLKEHNITPYGMGIGFPRNSNKHDIETEVYTIAERTKWWNLMNKKDNEEDE